MSAKKKKPAKKTAAKGRKKSSVKRRPDSARTKKKRKKQPVKKKTKTSARRKTASKKSRSSSVKKRKTGKKASSKRVIRKKRPASAAPQSKPDDVSRKNTDINTGNASEDDNIPKTHYVRHIPGEDELLLKVRKYREKINLIKNEVKKGIIGQDSVIDSILKCMVSGGHVLLESVPGLAKTFTAMLLNETMEKSQFNRIQFTPDLLPTDITGVTVYDKIKGFYVMKGPIFANVVLADELNRAPPKVQSAMLQAMQESEVTIGRKTYHLPEPFFVLATQNPLEQQGVYPLSAAQIDRFLFKIYVDYPDEENEFFVMDSNSNMKSISDYGIKKVISPDEILEMQDMVKYLHISHELKEYIVNIVDATRNPDDYGLDEYGKYIQFGGSPRATINIALSAKATALLNGRIFVTPEDIRSVTKEVLRHRVLLNYEGKAREISTDDVVDEILKRIPVL